MRFFLFYFALRACEYNGDDGGQTKCQSTVVLNRPEQYFTVCEPAGAEVFNDTKKRIFYDKTFFDSNTAQKQSFFFERTSFFSSLKLFSLKRIRSSISGANSDIEHGKLYRTQKHGFDFF